MDMYCQRQLVSYSAQQDIIMMSGPSQFNVTMELW